MRLSRMDSGFRAAGPIYATCWQGRLYESGPHALSHDGLMP